MLSHAPTLPADALGPALHGLVAELLPLRRCLTGDGLRQSLALLAEHVPLAVTEVASGTAVLDWTVPPEWRVAEAYVEHDGRRVVDWADSALHLVQYSTAVRGRLRLRDLRPHLHTLPGQPALVPYRTAYYAPTWGFCLAHDTLETLAEEVGEDGELDVVIDAETFDGSMSVGEVVVPGETERELLVSAHTCHPSLANDNASGLAVAVGVARRLMDGPALRHTVRFVFAPGTIGAIAWLALNRETLGRIDGGLVLANLGDRGGFVYKRSRRGTLDAPLGIDRAVAVALRDLGEPVEVRDFAPTGYDERQYNSPGFDLPVGRLTRTPHGEYPEYHTSGDDLSLVTPAALAGAVDAVEAVVRAFDGDAVYRNRQPFGEPQLGRRGLYAALGGSAHGPDAQRAALWTLNLSDGRHSLLDVAERSGLPFATVRQSAEALVGVGLLDSD